VRVADASYDLGPLERRAFAIVEERRLAPGVQGVNALLGLARGPRVLGVQCQCKRRSRFICETRVLTSSISECSVASSRAGSYRLRCSPMSAGLSSR
jgi:hypothetical protein